MSEFHQRLATELQDRRLLARGQKLLVAVSGGVDSMVLLHGLYALAQSNHWRISVAHFNHHLRGRASNADEQVVRKTAKALRLKLTVGDADVKAFAVRSKLSVEMAARKLRHEFLARTARQQHIKTIALAHHADDQVELFFLRLLRGAGNEGLAGMKWRSPSPADPGITLIRPLLGFSKAELLEVARAQSVPFRDDATNFSSDMLRNRIRNELLPSLRREYQPAIDKTVLRVMEIAGAEAEFIRQAASTVSGDFDDVPLALQRKVLQQRLTESGLQPDFELIEKLRAVPGRLISVGAGLTVRRDKAGKVSLNALTSQKFGSAELRIPLTGRAGRAAFGGRNFRWTLKSSKVAPKRLRRQPGAEIFDADKLGGEIVLRHWRPGDRFQPIDMKSPAKLQNLFVNAKIPSARRRELVLAATVAGEIFWVEELRIGELAKVSAQTQRQFGWKWSNFRR